MQGRGAPRGARGSSVSGRGRGGPQGPQPTMDKPKREAILDLSKYVNERIRVKFTGGREVTGVLKGYDQLLNLVLDEVEEQLSGGFDNPRIHMSHLSHYTEPSPRTRTLGLVVLRGPTITLLSPVDGFEEIANPFMAQE
ncbi:U6 snRNA-associated Sm-like protein LSm7 [Neolentinus lepideus HHB14362 ss-1]|uniref:U6 snRNA-associated Sm-like protein LSm7 n=1 Tax=Neolentinus lepideus HHB14362 ss-1 TaxID=1314782 RepID=A0A165QY40_9AGAM|nr:U6 snRNA-associated Sm-like protein LSm7 [Neolentinus lepideus HHB14362 ss-1]